MIKIKHDGLKDIFRFWFLGLQTTKEAWNRQPLLIENVDVISVQEIKGHVFIRFNYKGLKDFEIACQRENISGDIKTDPISISNLKWILKLLTFNQNYKVFFAYVLSNALTLTIAAALLWILFVSSWLKDYFLSDAFLSTIPSFSGSPDRTRAVIKVSFILWGIILPILIFGLFFSAATIMNLFRLQNGMLVGTHRLMGYMTLIISLGFGLKLMTIWAELPIERREIFMTGMSPLKINEVVERINKREKLKSEADVVD